MKLDESTKIAIVVMLWVSVSILMVFIILIFIKDTVSAVQIRMLIVAAILAITAKYFMKED